MRMLNKSTAMSTMDAVGAIKSSGALEPYLYIIK